VRREPVVAPAIARPAAPQPEVREQPAPVARTTVTETGESRFIAPQPVAAPRPAYAARPAEAPVRREPMADNRGGANDGGFNFFQRVAGMGRALSPRADEQQEAAIAPQPQTVREPAVKMAVHENPAKEAQDDYLDIPAFLRRQAN
jgi:hypothetical protein